MSRYHTPPSLAWLVKKHKITANRIVFLENRLEEVKTRIDEARTIVWEYENLPEVLTTLKTDLDAIDRMIRLHEIPIDPKKIGVKGVHLNPRKHSHGAMTRAIYACLAIAPRRWKTTTEIALFVAKECSAKLLKSEFPSYRQDVGRRMRGMLRENKIDRAHRVGHNDEALWRQKAAPEDKLLFTD